MHTPWDFIKRKRSGTDGSIAVRGQDVEAETASPLLEKVGERNELLHVRFSYMADRLEDLKSLSDDFHLLSKPIEELSTELPKAKARILELEALLRRESEERTRIQKELVGTAEKLSTLSNDYHALYNRNKAVEGDLDQIHASAAADRAKLSESLKLLENVEQQLLVERESRQRLDAEVHELAAVASGRAAELQKAQEQAAAQADRIALLEREVPRLQAAIDKQVHERVELQARLNEADRAVHERNRDLADFQQKLDAEITARQQSEHAHGSVQSGLQAEKASLLLQVEALTARTTAAEQLVNKSRLQLSEKDAALRNSDGVVRNLERQCEVAERQNANLEQRLNAKAAELVENQRLADGLSKRCDMLAKALSAKEAALNSALEKARARSERVEEITRAFELERASLEASHRRLVEELENERAERTLAQGALNIARESRASLQRLNESLKRANRSFQPVPTEDIKPAAEPQSNVSILPVGPKPTAGPDQS
jgi:crescentin